jgi:hypothetical protein
VRKLHEEGFARLGLAFDEMHAALGDAEYAFRILGGGLLLSGRRIYRRMTALVVGCAIPFVEAVFLRTTAVNIRNPAR